MYKNPSSKITFDRSHLRFQLARVLGGCTVTQQGERIHIHVKNTEAMRNCTLLRCKFTGIRGGGVVSQ